MRTLTQGLHSVHYKGSWLYLEIIIIHKTGHVFSHPQVLQVNTDKKILLFLMYNRTVTKISSCQVYEISRKELNS